jgi:flagellar biosynthesis/type III secretory pathway protein FliH
MVLLGKRSGTRALSRIRSLISRGHPLTEADRVDFMFLPLMRHARPAEIIAREAVALARQIPQPEQLRLLGPLLGLSYHYLGEGILNTLMEELMATSTMRELFADILEQGIEQGIQQGVEQGMAQGIQQGMEQGKVAGQRDYILRTLARRLGPVPVALQEDLAHVSDLAQLDALFDAALTVERIEDFAALLPARS